MKATEEIPLHGGLMIPDVASFPLRPWSQLGEGVSGLYLRFAGYQIIDGRILEIAAGGKTASQRQLCEMVIYCISGNGDTSLQLEVDLQEVKLEWARELEKTTRGHQ